MEDIELKEGEDNLIDEETKKKTTKNTLIAITSLIIIFALIFGVNYLYSKTHRNPYEYEYNGFEFKKYSDGKWYTQIRWSNKLITIPLSFGPRDLEDIQIIGKVDERFAKSKDVFITFDPAKDVLLPTGAIVKEKLGYVALAATELTLNLAQGMNMNPIAACTKNDSSCEGRPIITCENGNATIYLKRNDTGIILDGNCIILSGEDIDLVKAVDRLLLYWYRIMP